MKQTQCPNCRFQIISAISNECPACGHLIDTDEVAPLQSDDDLYSKEYPDDGDPASDDFLSEPSGSFDVAPDELDFDNDVAEDSDAPEFTELDGEAPEIVQVAPEPDRTPEVHGLLYLLFSPMGRANRRGFISGFLAIVSLICIGFLAVCCSDVQDEAQVESLMRGIVMVMAIPLMLLSIKRFHDFGYSGFYVLLTIFCGGIPILIALMVMAGIPHRNSYGRRPKLSMAWTTITAQLLLVVGGVYSFTIMSMLAEAEEAHEVIWQEFEHGNLFAAQATAKELYWQSEQGARICPVCPEFIALGMNAAMIAGRVHAAEEQPDEALIWLTRAERLAVAWGKSDDDPDFKLYLADLRVALADAMEATGKVDKALALRELAEGDLPAERDDSTIALLDEIWTRADLLSDKGDHRSAEEQFGQIIDLGTAHLDESGRDADVMSQVGGAHHNRGVARYNLGDFNGALADIAAAIRWQSQAYDIYPEMNHIRISLVRHYQFQADLQLELEDIAAAVESLTRARSLDRNNHVIATMLGMLHYTQLDFRAAVDLLSESVTQQPDVEVEALLVAALLQLGRTERADIVVSRMERNYRNSAEASFLRGILQMQHGDFSGAVDSLQSARTVQPMSPGVLHNLIVSLCYMDQESGAEAILLQLSSLDSQLAASARDCLRTPAEDREEMPLVYEMEP